jgi:hypothetical protein
VLHLGVNTSNTDFGTQGPKNMSFWILGYRLVLGQNRPQIWTRGKGLIKGRYLDFGATLGCSHFKYRFWDPGLKKHEFLDFGLQIGPRTKQTSNLDSR